MILVALLLGVSVDGAVLRATPVDGRASRPQCVAAAAPPQSTSYDTAGFDNVVMKTCAPRRPHPAATSRLRGFPSCAAAARASTRDREHRSGTIVFR